jgi:MFS family permease
VTEAPPAPSHATRNGALALAVICVAQLMVVLDATVVNVALPSIREDLDFSRENLTWVVTAYSLAFGGLLLFGGRTGDLFGRRRMFMIGIAIFSVASLVGGFANGEAMLIIARAAQGLGGAIAAPTALALLATTFTEPAARARAFGVFAAMAASGGALGLLLGGVLTDYASWRWALFINAPIGAIVLFMAPRVLNESQGSGTKLDLPGAVSVTAGMSTLVYGLTKAADDGWGSTTTVVTLAVAAALLVAFVIIEHFSEHPLMPFHIFANRNRTGAYLIMLFLAAALFTTFYFLAQYLQNVHGWSPFHTGVGFLPMPATIMFMSIVVHPPLPDGGSDPGDRRDGLVLPAGREQQLLAVPRLDPAAGRRHGLQLRAADHDGRQRRRAARDGAGVRAAEHRPAGRRGHRPGRLRHDLRPRLLRPGQRARRPRQQCGRTGGHLRRRSAARVRGGHRGDGTRAHHLPRADPRQQGRTAGRGPRPGPRGLTWQLPPVCDARPHTVHAVSAGKEDVR